MTYKECLNYLYTQLPQYQRKGKAAYKADLSNIIKLMELLGNPHCNFKSIHIAGTNGKGSAAHIIAATFIKAGYKTGLYTSPHLIDFRERVRINGKKISKSEVTDFVITHKDKLETINPSFFEWTAALAFSCFLKEKVDVAVIETGLGGRLDSTNIVTPELSVITNVGKDHKQFLGDTIEKIAAEKAGIIKPGVPVVTGKMKPAAFQVIKTIAQRQNAPLIKSEAYTSLPESDLIGNYQKENFATAQAAIKQLTSVFLKLTDSVFYESLKNITELTGLRGRWEIVSKQPYIVADVAHNAEGLAFTMRQLKETDKEMHILFGTVNDKELDLITDILPRNARYYLCAPDIERALPAKELKAFFDQHHFISSVHESVSAAYQAAKQNLNPETVLYIGGSTFVVSDFFSFFDKKDIVD